MSSVRSTRVPTGARILNLEFASVDAGEKFDAHEPAQQKQHAETADKIGCDNCLSSAKQPAQERLISYLEPSKTGFLMMS